MRALCDVTTRWFSGEQLKMQMTALVQYLGRAGRTSFETSGYRILLPGRILIVLGSQIKILA